MTITELYPEPGPHSTAVTVYTTPNCGQCVLTKHALKRKGVLYTEVDITEDATALDYIKNTLGHSQAPVVVAWPENLADPVDWYGFRPDLISRYLKSAA